MAPRLIALISPDAVGYLSTLLAPAATGEVLTKTEYLDLVASIYDKPGDRSLSNEIAAARIHAVISFPGTISAVRGGTFSGNQARFSIPLLDLLVLEQALDYEVIWK
jgi:hypothetical protein